MNCILDHTCDHGYSPMKALRSLGIVFLASWLLAWGAGLGDTPLITPSFDPFESASTELTYRLNTCFKIATKNNENDLDCYGYNSFLYALDEFLPVINLEHAEKFDLRRHLWDLAEFVQMIVQILGWFLISAAIVTFTGILRRD